MSEFSIYLNITELTGLKASFPLSTLTEVRGSVPRSATKKKHAMEACWAHNQLKLDIEDTTDNL